MAGLIWCVYFAGAVYLDIDEVADCNVKQWMAGGKQVPETDIASNVTFQREEGNIVADFRGLQKKLVTYLSDVVLSVGFALPQST